MMPDRLDIEVIPPDAKWFREAFMVTQTPVVIRGLFDATPLGRVKSIEAVRDQIGGAVVHVKPNVIERYVGAVNPTLPFSWSKLVVRTTPTTIAQYLDDVARNPADKRIASEQRAPSEIVEMLASDTFLEALGAGGLRAGKHSERSKTSALVFLANRGNASDTHTDFDGRHVFSYQVFGRKKFIVFPPSSGPKLSPIEIFSMVRLRGMSERSLAAFVEYAGGAEVVLEPGDAIYIPPFYYHHVEYLELAMGITLRFAPPDERLESCVFRCHRDMWTQNVWARILRDPDSAQAEQALVAFEQALAAPYRSRVAKYRAIRGLARAYCEEWGVFGDDPTDAWLSSSDFLEYLLSMRYVVGGRVTATGSTMKVMWGALREISSNTTRRQVLWRSKEKARFAMEILGRRMLSLLEQA